jgi:hypothetical protein
MTDAVQIEMIRAIPGFAGAVGAVAAAWFSYRASTHSKQTLDVATRTEHNTNGLVEKLNLATAKVSRAEGNLEGRAELKQENAQDPKAQDEPHGSGYEPPA